MLLLCACLDSALHGPLWAHPVQHLNQELVAPVVQGFKALGIVHIIHQHAAIRAAVERNAQALKAFLQGAAAAGRDEKEGRRHPSCACHPTRTCPAVSQICSVTVLSSISISFVRKSAPMVALYSLVNFFCTYWFMRLVLPTPESPKMMTLSSRRFLPGGILLRYCGGELREGRGNAVALPKNLQL